MKRVLPVVLLFAAWPAFASEHEDPIAPVVLAFAIILIAAKLGGHLAVLAGQPSVLGELLVGVVLGNLNLVGLTQLGALADNPAVDTAARLGVLVLLFEVGLESTVAQMLKVGVSSLLVAVLGVVTPFALGWGVGVWLLPGHSSYVHAFLGATLCATSVGITARVLADLKRSQSTEARIIVGAAVLDDVLGLIVLAVVTGVIASADADRVLSVGAIGWIAGKAIIFLFGALGLGLLVSKKLFRAASRLRSTGTLVAFGLSFCFLLSWAANEVGLAPIVGAFAAGLILEETHYVDFKTRGEHGLEELMHPIAQFLVPIFFVQMGMRTDLVSFTAPGVLGLAAALTVVAIVGKQACSLGVLGPGLDRFSVGIGMVPRGEVGLIFANIGAQLTVKGERVIDHHTFSAVVVMVIITTMVTPPALKFSLGRWAKKHPTS